MSAEVWIVDDDPSIRWVLEKALHKAGFKVRSFASALEAEHGLTEACPAVLLTDVRMPEKNGIAFLSTLKERFPELPVVVMTAFSDFDTAVTSMKEGAFEYLPKPFDLEEVVRVVRRAFKNSLQREGELEEGEGTSEIIGRSPAMQRVFRAIGRLAHSSVTVLITGESGTGKELVARALHRHSPRARGPFIALNMAAIPKELLEAELFGHEKGAFTGAHKPRSGRFEQASGGTLFLDEIGDMPFELQTRLLRVLQEGEFYPLGATTPKKVDVRIIAATNQHLERLVQEGRFREDLYYRLNVIRLHLPPLRERQEDIPLLLRHFLKKAAKELGLEEPKVLAPEVEHHLIGLEWPGNVRQLENLCRWLTVMAPSRIVHLEDLPEELKRTPPKQQPLEHRVEALPSSTEGDWRLLLKRWAEEELHSDRREIAKRALREAERILIETALEHTRGCRIEAAKLLGYGRNTLTRKLKKFEG